MNKDTRDLLAAVEASPDGIHTLSTVVAVAGSSYRRPGARMLVHASGRITGSVSGGCLEAEIARRGRWWAEAGPVVRRFESADDVGTGCGGTIDILVENTTAADPTGPLAALRWIATRRTAACLATVVAGPALGTRCAFTADDSWPAPSSSLVARCAADARTVLATGASVRRRHDPYDVFFEHIPAARELLVAGRHHDVAPLVRIARLVGWDVTVAAAGVAPRALGDPDHLLAPTEPAVAAWLGTRPGAAVLLMTHSADLDRRLLATVLTATTPAYLGVLGPPHRTADLVSTLDLPPRALAAIRTPVGLDLGGDGPEAIALSIVADLQATWYRRTAARLCNPDTALWRPHPQLATAS